MTYNVFGGTLNLLNYCFHELCYWDCFSHFLSSLLIIFIVYYAKLQHNRPTYSNVSSKS